MKRFGRYKDAQEMLLNEDGTLRTVEHCLSVVAMLLSQVEQSEAETRALQERLDWSLKS
jgi:hypothetical protein